MNNRFGPRVDPAVVETVQDQPIPQSQGYEVESASQLANAIRMLAQEIQERELLVDEYLTQTGVPVAATKVQLQPQYEPYWEIIHRIIITGPTVPSLAAVTGRNTVTNPGANATIINAGALLNGVEYQVSWSVELEGTVTAADADNMKLTGPAALNEGADYPGVAGLYEQNTVTVLGDGVTNLTVKTVGASSGAAAIYGAQVSAVPLAPTFTLQLGDRFWNLALPSSGLLEFSFGGMLSRVDPRILTSNVPGPWSLELTGRADVRNRR